MSLDWHAETVRLSLFTKDALKVTDHDWQTITGQEEAETRSQIPGGRVLVGPFLGGQFTIASTVNRVDCVLSPTPPASDKPPEGDFPNVGKWSDVSGQFLAATTPWVHTVSAPIVRIAFGASLAAKAANREDSYLQLKGLLTSVDVDPEMRDLIYRVNWPRLSARMQGVRINRITSFSSIQVILASIQLSGTGVSTSPMVPGVNITRMETDHNTDQDRVEPLEPAVVISIYEELVALTDENAQRGEVR